MNDWGDMARYLYGYLAGSQRLSAAGRLLDSLDNAERAITGEADITDELRCALRRADIKAMRT
jgi:hypothetical protein